MRSRAGFTLLEALITLAITAMTLSLIFSVGARGAFTGFRLGNRALALSDTEVAKAAYRDVIASIVVPPVAVSSQAAETELEQQTDDSFVGEPAELAGYLVAGRDTPCSLTGAAGRLTLTLVAGKLDTTVACRLDDGDPVKLVTLKGTGAAFSYSEDGTQWFSDWNVERGMPVERASLPNGEARKVLVRLGAADGASQIIALASSGRSLPQVTAATTANTGTSGAAGTGGTGATPGAAGPGAGANRGGAGPVGVPGGAPGAGRGGGAATPGRGAGR